MSLKIISVCVLLIGCLLDESAAACNECLPTGIKCLDKTNFEMCDGPLNGTKLSCSDDKVCTNSEKICETLTSNGTVKPDCEEGSTCTDCEETGEVVCVGPKQFSICVGKVKSDPLQCPTDAPNCFEGLKDRICVSDGVLAVLDEKPSCPGPQSTPTTPAELNKKCRVAAEEDSDEIEEFRLKIDGDCTGYIYCELVNGRFQGTAMKCAPGYKFDESSKKCKLGTC